MCSWAATRLRLALVVLALFLDLYLPRHPRGYARASSSLALFLGSLALGCCSRTCLAPRPLASPLIATAPKRPPSTGSARFWPPASAG